MARKQGSKVPEKKSSRMHTSCVFGNEILPAFSVLLDSLQGERQRARDRKGGRASGRGREGGRERERERDRQTDRQKIGQIETETDRYK